MQKTAVVVGGASGVGRGIALALGHRGYRLVVGDRNALVDLECEYIALDASDDASVAHFRQTFVALNQPLDALAITVGAIDEGSVIGASQARWQWMMQANLLASVRVVNALLPLMPKGASVLLTGSGSGMTTPDPETGLGLYAVTKHAMTGYFRALRADAARAGIAVSLLLPTGVKGELAANSARQREQLLGEPFAPERGQQLPGRPIVDADTVGDDFVRRWLEGQAVISNAPQALIASVVHETDLLIGALLGR